MERTIKKNEVALVIRKEVMDDGEEFLDLQVIPPEPEDEYLIQVANLAAHLLEQAMFGETDEFFDDEGVDVEPELLAGLDLGDFDD